MTIKSTKDIILNLIHESNALGLGPVVPRPDQHIINSPHADTWKGDYSDIAGFHSWVHHHVSLSGKTRTLETQTHLMTTMREPHENFEDFFDRVDTAHENARMKREEEISGDEENEYLQSCHEGYDDFNSGFGGELGQHNANKLHAFRGASLMNKNINMAPTTTHSMIQKHSFEGIGGNVPVVSTEVHIGAAPIFHASPKDVAHFGVAHYSDDSDAIDHILKNNDSQIIGLGAATNKNVSNLHSNSLLYHPDPHVRIALANNTNNPEHAKVLSNDPNSNVRAVLAYNYKPIHEISHMANDEKTHVSSIIKSRLKIS